MSEYWLILVAFVTSSIAAVFGMGGGVLLITLMAGLVPPAAIIPIHAATQLASNGSRALFGWRHIDTSLIIPFIVGAVLGVLLGGQLYQNLQLQWLPAIIGVVILVITWLPLPTVRGIGNWPLVLLGFYQTGLGMLIGATGPLGAAVLAQRKQERDWLVVNTGVYMSCNHLLRIAAFGAMGFAFSDYLMLMLGMIVGVVAGSWLGTRLRQYVPQGNFQLWFKLLVSAMAVRMIAITWMGS
mgnify:CR=1 FL=1|jgi:uncharacterized protein